MNNLASKNIFSASHYDHSPGFDDEGRGNLYSEAVRAARRFVSQSAKFHPTNGNSWFVDTVVVPDLARQFGLLGHVVSHSQKSEIKSTINTKGFLHSYAAPQGRDATEGSETTHFYFTPKPGGRLNPDMWLSPGVTVSGQEFSTIGQKRRVNRATDLPHPGVLKQTGSSETRQVHEARPIGFENLAQFKQASFEELGTSFATQAFVASDKLLRIWAEGLNALRAEADAEPIVIPSDRTDRSLHKELEREVDSIISNYSRYMSNRYGGQSFKLTFGGQFYAPFETVVADTLILPPRTSVLFLDELMRLLVEQAQDGAKFKRRWGELGLDSTGNLLLKLQKPKVRRTADYF